MGFVNHNQIVVAPVQTIQIQAIRGTVRTVQISMVQNIIAKSVAGNRVVDVVIFVGIPVVGKLLGTKHQNGLVTILVVLDNCQGSKCFTKTDAIGQNTAIVLFQFVDDRENSIFLKIIEHTPDFTVLKTSRLIGQYVFRNIF